MGIVVNDSQNLFMLQTRSNSYAFGIDNQGLVRHLYWGSRINAMEDFEMPELAKYLRTIRYMRSQKKNFLYTEVFDTKNTV